MVNKKNKNLVAQIATHGPTKEQQRIARRVQQYDELTRRGQQQPLPADKDAGTRVKKSAPTKHDRRISRACQHHVKLARREVRWANRGNIAALLDATRSSRPDATTTTTTTTTTTETGTETGTEHLFQFCGNIITAQDEDEDKAIQAAVEASAAPFDPYRHFLFASGTCGKVKGVKKQPGATTTGAATILRRAVAAVVCKTASGRSRNEGGDTDAGHTWEEKSFSMNLSPGNSTTQGIEVGLRSVAEALALVATQVACTRDEGMSHDNNLHMRPKVTVFTDSRAVVAKISKINLTAQQLKSAPWVEKLMTRSEYLRHLGVEIELRWSPCLQSEGTKRAKRASRRAAKSHGACVDSVDQDLQILVDSLEQE
ncbi:hypothetical protein KVR01_010332 [Diaporthe batatas]|uniref:uncharacterized protein n=1 Tax=Diaporthe batatas TaxID=748121 RepID=UPI001D0508B8|nr:uncharacterized protein KVR01_010332 [Diaporthe batatas]KAG8159695.1 hypothetical protein KVR01_010332 [Diaporthe batatas]